MVYNIYSRIPEDKDCKRYSLTNTPIHIRAANCSITSLSLLARVSNEVRADYRQVHNCILRYTFLFRKGKIFPYIGSNLNQFATPRVAFLFFTEDF